MENELVISGNISEQEINEIQKIITDGKVFQMRTKAFDPIELIQLVFNDFSVYEFTRDLVIGEFLNRGIKQVKSVIEYFKNRRKSIDVASIVIDIKKDKKTITLTVLFNPDNLDSTIDLLNQKIDIVLENVEGINQIEVRLSQDGSDLQIDKM